MRSKLLSLHLVLTVLNSHMSLFVDPSAIIYSSSSNEATNFVQAINQYLCLCLSRNAVSPVPQVFEISVEIFWRVLAGMRTKLKVSSFSSVPVLWLTYLHVERNRSSFTRDFHSHPGDENFHFETKSRYSCHVISAMPRPAGSCGNLSEL